MQLPIPNIYFLRMISKFSGLLIPLRTAICFSRTSTSSAQGWCTSNCMKLDIGKTGVISFSRKTNALIYDYKLCQSSITRSHSIKDLGVYTDNKLHFHGHVNYIFSQSTRLLGLIRNITFNLSSIESMLRLYIALVRSKLEYASVVWNSIISTDASKLGRIQQRFAALCLYRFFAQVRYCYALALQESNLHTLHMRRHRLDAVFLTQVYSESKFCSSVLETVGLRVLPRRIRDFALFSVCSSCRNCPSARCASAANVVLQG
jgi:hypothetical protein